MGVTRPACGRGCSSARVENFPDVCMNKFFSPPSARSKLLAAGWTVRCTAIIDFLKFVSHPLAQLHHANVSLIKWNISILANNLSF